MSLTIGMGVRVIHTPAGQCPVKLNSTEIEEIRVWANSVVEHGRQNNLTYLPSAILYFSQQFYPYLTPEYKIVKKNIEEIFNFNSLEISQYQKIEVKNNTDDKSQIKEKINDIKDQKPVETKKRRGRPPKKI